MSESILTSTKKILGLDADYTAFDLDIITHINTALADLHQLGIGPPNGFAISDEAASWDELLTFDGVTPDLLLNTVKTYVYLRVRSYFDPPNTSYLIKALEDQISKMEWRLSMYRESLHWENPNPEEVEV